jgi:hypothetical protein
VNEFILLSALSLAAQTPPDLAPGPQAEAYEALVRTGASPAEIAEYLRVVRILKVAVPVEPESLDYEETDFDRIDPEGSFAVVVRAGRRPLRIPVSAFRGTVWYGAGFSRFAAPGKARYIAIRRDRAGNVVEATIHMVPL